MIVKSIIDIKFSDLVLVDYLLKNPEHNLPAKIEFTHSLTCSNSSIEAEINHFFQLEITPSEQDYLNKTGIFADNFLKQIEKKYTISAGKIVIETDLASAIYLSNFIGMILNDAHNILSIPEDQFLSKESYNMPVFFEGIKQIHALGLRGFSFVEDSVNRFSYKRQLDMIGMMNSHLIRFNCLLGSSNLKISEILKFENPVLSVSPKLFEYGINMSNFFDTTDFRTYINPTETTVLDAIYSLRYDNPIAPNKKAIENFLKTLPSDEPMMILLRPSNAMALNILADTIEEMQLNSFHDIVFFVPKEYTAEDISGINYKQIIWIDGKNIADKAVSSQSQTAQKRRMM